ncbi:MAG: hypothetical protein ACXWDO_01925 [Bacteroidia bacterium]
MKRIKILLFFCLATVYCNAQDTLFSKNSLKFGAGLGFADDGRNSLVGIGTSYFVGYQRNIWRERFRFSPQISFGIYSSKGADDVPDQFFNVINFQNNLYFDLVKYKAVSIVIAGGFFMNTNRGLIAQSRYRNTRYFIEYNIGASGGTGFRINPKNKRLALDLMLLNLNYASSDFTESGIKIGIDYKLK